MIASAAKPSCTNVVVRVHSSCSCFKATSMCGQAKTSFTPMLAPGAPSASARCRTNSTAPISQPSLTGRAGCCRSIGRHLKRQRAACSERAQLRRSARRRGGCGGLRVSLAPVAWPSALAARYSARSCVAITGHTLLFELSKIT